jgi:tetratricopeptide (TPR) repeat protein
MAVGSLRMSLRINRNSMQKSNTKAGAAKSATKPAPSTPEPSAQQKSFTAAMQAFHMRDFSKAKQHFEAAVEGPAKEIGYAAKQHVLMCQQRLAKSTVKLDNVEDLYNFGISQMNQRDLDGAQASFEKALKHEDADYVHYALALVHGLKQDVNGAAQHLKRAIEISPRNRVSAHNDPDFSELMQHAAIRELLSGSH